MAKQKVRPVDENGLYLHPSLKIWKQKNPGKLWFHSPFEHRCYVKLKRSGLEFSCQPEAIEMIPAFVTISFIKNKIVSAKVQDAVYTPDFFIKTRLLDIYIECKGFFTDLARMRFKMLQYTLLKDGNDKSVILLIKNDLEFDRMLSIAQSEFNSEKTKTLKL